jgi:hypothetical protein
MLASAIVTLAYDLMQRRGTASGTVDTNRRIKTDAEAPSLLTMWQNEISRFGRYYKTYEHIHRPHTDLIVYGYDDKVMSTGTLVLEGSGSVKSYTFEIDAPCTVLIQDYTSTWNTLATVTKADGDVTRYSAAVTPTSGATKSRISISGTYLTVLKNYALYSSKYYVIPEYRKEVRVALPTDCRWQDIVIDECDFKYQGISLDIEGNSFVVDNDIKSTTKIVYKPTPAAITALTDTILVDDAAALSGAYFLAANFMLLIDPNTASFFQQKFEEARDSLKQPGRNVDIEDAYGGYYESTGTLSGFSNSGR